MDVKCERCNTEYEFDDALVSGRGTTVKCTNCGHKFKIRRSDGDFSEDFWNVTTNDGRTLVFTSLRELQRAIQGYLVERNDRLSRGGLPPKAIGQIPELAPFFDQREAAKRSHLPQAHGRTHRTQDGLGPAAEAARQQTADYGQDPPGKTTLIGTGPALDEEAFPARPATLPPPTEPQSPGFESPLSLPSGFAPTALAPPVAAPAPAPPPVPRVSRTAPPPPVASAKPPPVQVSQPPPVPARQSANPILTKTMAMDNRPTPPPLLKHGSTVPMTRSAPPVPEQTSRPPLGSNPHPSSAPAIAAPVYTPPPPIAESSSPLPPAPRARSLLEEIEEERDRVRDPSDSVPEGLPRRRSVGGFIVATVVAGCVAMLGALWAQKNLGVTLGTRPPPPAVATVDPRVATFLSTGEKALGDGNLDLAKESFDKASALAEKDPKVLLGLARLAAMRADVFWLKSRLLPENATDDHRITRDGLGEAAVAARKAADDALAVAPDDPSALRAKIDALRISGDREGARALVGKVSANAAQPESAYVLAALDLAEIEPLWPTVIERLKIASSVETGPGRARAALVFALGKSGDGETARAEVDRLAAMPKAHPLLSFLRAFAERAKGGAPPKDAGAPATVAVAAVAVPSGPIPTEPPDPNKPKPVVAASPAGGIPSDPRELVSQGERARAKGDYDRARTLFSAAVDRNGNDSEALAGLAAIAYAQHDLASARTAYKRVLAINPNYMPAVVGLADVEWDSGDKATATKMYKDIVDRYPEGAYPGRVKQRSEGGG